MFFLSWKLPVKALTTIVVSETVCACAIAVGYIVAKTENCIYIALVLMFLCWKYMALNWPFVVKKVF
ncbi:hypothetical protein EU799_04615 [Corynebacterium silvaticum]|uniref:Uncharacterized protein n=1 Tax=Corynebacterium silvaticum TaxID=2320431 RepID=A0A7U5K8X1_9CORY|nr:hypothetical protein EU802_03045 [Corynebacterium silvaticum]TFA96814.1 hypothetical protein EU799_04615 [Corynebacterium silvaticum]TNX84930.1 hypothetical protein FIT55_03230 [Corynebacterium silvaticum]TRM14809.1 hypothetical protein ET810_011320 [Corynebacterium silvaticum]